MFRVRVEPLRDPDTAEILGWLAKCPNCFAYLITSGRRGALNAAGRHDCPEAPPQLSRWRWPWSA